MQSLSVIGFMASIIGLLVVAAIRPRRPVLSSYELERRKKSGNSEVDIELQRIFCLQEIVSLQRILEAILLVLAVVMAFSAFQAGNGLIISVGIALMYRRVAGIEMIRTIAQRLYDQHEIKLLAFVERHSSVLRHVRGISEPEPVERVASREELEHVISSSGSVVTVEERKRLLSSLRFHKKTVEEVMTPRGVIVTVRKDDLIGPLMLDELHQTGHSRFPVIDGDLDHVVGVLHMKNLVGLEQKESVTAGALMEPKVFYVNQDQTLEHALAAFLSTHHHLFVVVNGYRETAGIVTLEDVMEAMLGYRIIDEFDEHEDLRVVAMRRAKANNDSPNGKNI